MGPDRGEKRIQAGTTMRTFVKLFLIAGLILAVLPRWGETCLPEFPQVVFARPFGPDSPMAEFAKGHIGIPVPTWKRAFLVVAFRYLADKPLSRTEQNSLLEFFDTEGVRGREIRESASANWLRERAKYRPGPPPAVSPYHPGALPYVQFLTCLPPAFENAARTLRSRARKFGPNSPDLQEWINGQDQVFANCGSGPSVPRGLPASANPLMRADRAYQIAAAHFYIPDLTASLQEFEAIAGDSSSPWREIAPYMAARIVIRQACCVPNKDGIDEDYNPVILRDAEARLKRIIADPQQKSFRKDAQRLQALVEFRLHPDRRQHELGRILLSGRSGTEFGQQLVDYKLLLDRFLDADPPFEDGESWGPNYERRARAWRVARYQQLQKERSDELSDWLMTLQSESNAAKLHALKMWQSTGSTPWLFAAMLKLNGNQESTPAVLRAAAAIPKTSPAYAAIAFHRSRLLRESGHLQTARAVIEEALQVPAPPSTLNLLKDEQLRDSASFDDLHGLLVRVPLWDGADERSGDSYCYYGTTCNVLFYGVPHPKKNTPLLPQFDPSVAETLNRRLPVELAAELAASDSLPSNLQSRLAPAVWARAVLLGNPAAAQRVAEAAVKARPELKPFAEEYAAAGSAEERHFVAIFAVSHFPGLRPFVESAYPRTIAFAKIDNFRDNWWCDDVGGLPDLDNFSKQGIDARYELRQLETRVEATPLQFLTLEQRALAETEWKQLLRIGLAGPYLARETLAWAHQHADDPRVPEALHFAWRAGRFSCDEISEGPEPRNLSREIFQLLHNHYPQSPWTKKTPIWY
jgi:hypothetical protein